MLFFVFALTVFRKYVVVFFALFFLFGFLRYGVTVFVPQITDVAYFNDLGGNEVIVGKVCGDPYLKNGGLYFEFCVSSLFVEEIEYDVVGKILVKTNRLPLYVYGDVLRVVGNVSAPVDFDEFSYSRFLAKDSIYSVMYNVRIVKLGSGGNMFWKVLFFIKHFLKDSIEDVFVAPVSGLVLGVLLGMRASIPVVILDNFKIVGLTHILAISGYNISLIISIFGFLLSSFSRKWRFFWILIGILVFAILTGLSASVVRASIMGGLTVFAMVSGRKGHAFLMLLYSGCLFLHLCLKNSLNLLEKLFLLLWLLLFLLCLLLC